MFQTLYSPVYEYSTMCLYVHQMCARCPWRPDEGIRSPKTAVIDNCKPPCGWCELNPESLHEQQAVFNNWAISPSLSVLVKKKKKRPIWEKKITSLTRAWVSERLEKTSGPRNFMIGIHDCSNLRESTNIIHHIKDKTKQYDQSHMSNCQIQHL